VRKKINKFQVFFVNYLEAEQNSTFTPFSRLGGHDPFAPPENFERKGRGG
jgi:hypothetical protein